MPFTIFVIVIETIFKGQNERPTLERVVMRLFLVFFLSVESQKQAHRPNLRG